MEIRKYRTSDCAQLAALRLGLRNREDTKYLKSSRLQEMESP